MSTENFDQQQPVEGDSAINLQDFLQLCLAKWRWFAVAVAAMLALAAYYLLSTAPTYTRTASLLIKEQDGPSDVSSQISSLASLGVFSPKANVYNEKIVLQSPALVLSVVRRLGLEMDYTCKPRLRTHQLYGLSLPVKAEMLDYPDNIGASFTLTLDRDAATVALSDFAYGDGETSDQVVAGALGDTLATPAGRIVVAATPYYGREENLETTVINVSRSSMQGAIAAYQGKLSVDFADKDAQILDITCNDTNIQRAEDFINTLISAYNEAWVRDKNQIATATSQFISNRLAVIEEELGNVDSDISSYRSEHLIPDVAAVSQMYLEQGKEASDQVLALNNELYMAQYIRQFLADERNNGQLLPVNSGLKSTTLEKQIGDYNTKMLERNSLVANSSANNPLVVDLDQALAASRDAIIISIDNQIKSVNAQIRSFRNSQAQSRSQIASSPKQATYLLSVERQQKVKEALYLFLLQKREENELSQAFTAYNTRLITPPMGPSLPTAPVRRNVLLIAIVVGMLIPAGLLFVQQSIDNKVRNRKDLASITAPFIGALPMAGKANRSSLTARVRALLGLKQKAGEIQRREIIVHEGSRNAINEAFRVVRSNLDFCIGHADACRVVMATSMSPNSGKTFVTANLAASFAIKGMKTCVVDLDLRKASMSNYVGRPAAGVANLLNGEVDDWHQIAVAADAAANLTFLPGGSIPPNPTELIYSPRMAKLLADLRKEFDIVFIDCPPVDVVADTAIITPLADITIFVIRSGLLDRRLVPMVQRFYEEKKFNNMTVVLNGIPATASSYGYGYVAFSNYDNQ